MAYCSHSYGSSPGKDYTPDGFKAFKRDTSKRLIAHQSSLFKSMSLSLVSCFLSFSQCKYAFLY